MINVWINLMPKYALEDLVGFIPTFLDAQDPRPAREQLDANYQHGGGWRAFRGHTFNRDDMTLEYPDDEPSRAYAMTVMPKTGETVIVFEHAWVCILQKDGAYEIARMD